jgi:hypothetical protein
MICGFFVPWGIQAHGAKRAAILAALLITSAAFAAVIWYHIRKGNLKD